MVGWLGSQHGHEELNSHGTGITDSQVKTPTSMLRPFHDFQLTFLKTNQKLNGIFL